jgi:hypothetical protein
MEIVRLRRGWYAWPKQTTIFLFQNDESLVNNDPNEIPNI